MTTTEGVDAIPHESEEPPFHGIVPGVCSSESVSCVGVLLVSSE